MVFTSSNLPAANADLDALLLTSLRVESSLFHLGQYCGNHWSASAHGHRRSSYHLVLHGHCRVELMGRSESPLILQAGDGIFFLRDIPHALQPQSEEACLTGFESSPMQALQPAQADSTGLACGFFRFPVALGETLAKTLPDWLVLRADDDRVQQARSVFQLIVEETRRQAAPSPLLLERLTDLLAFFVLRRAMLDNAANYGLLVLASDPQMAALVQAVMDNPGDPWTMDQMAALVPMSRATFHRRFTLLSGTTPARWVLDLRMQMACHELDQGASVQQVCEKAGYQSVAAFSKVFQRSLGLTPAAWRRRDEREARPR